MSLHYLKVQNCFLSLLYYSKLKLYSFTHRLSDQLMDALELLIPLLLHYALKTHIKNQNLRKFNQGSNLLNTNTNDFTNGCVFLDSASTFL